MGEESNDAATKLSSQNMQTKARMEPNSIIPPLYPPAKSSREGNHATRSAAAHKSRGLTSFPSTGKYFLCNCLTRSSEMGGAKGSLKCPRSRASFSAARFASTNHDRSTHHATANATTTVSHSTSRIVK